MIRSALHCTDSTTRVLPGRAALLSLAAIQCLLACSPDSSGEMPEVTLGAPEDPSAEFSKIRYGDRDLLSLNERCPLTGDPLSALIEPIYINGRPLGFC